MNHSKISYGDDVKQIIDIFTPQVANQTIVFVHGGAWISSNNSDFFELAQKWALHLTATVILIDYRLTTKEIDNKIIDPMHQNDVKAALVLISKSFADFVCIGHSAGSSLLYNSLTNEMPVRCLISIEGIYDFEDLLKRHPSYGDWFLFHAFPNRSIYNERSSLNPHFKFRQLVVHSVNDELVDYAHAQWFCSTKGIPLVSVTGQSHDGILESPELVAIIKRNLD